MISSLLHAGSLGDVSPSRLLEVLASESDGYRAPASQALFDLTGLENIPEDIAHLVQASRLVIRRLGLEPGQRAVLVNGRVRYLLVTACIELHPQHHETAYWTL